MVSAAHALIGGAGAIAALTSAGKPVALGTTMLMAGVFAANFAFTGAVMAALWRTDLRRSLPVVYPPLLLCLFLLVWIGPLLWILAALTLYASLVVAARARFHFDRRVVVASPGATCVRCGYDFAGLPRSRAPVCPECGVGRTPTRAKQQRNSM